jgi:hypothetical protein
MTNFRLLTTAAITVLSAATLLAGCNGGPDEPSVGEALQAMPNNAMRFFYYADETLTGPPVGSWFLGCGTSYHTGVTTLNYALVDDIPCGSTASNMSVSVSCYIDDTISFCPGDICNIMCNTDENGDPVDCVCQ